MENKKKNLFNIAKENAKYKVCPGCGAKKLVDEFKKTNKYCNGCPTVAEIREKYKNKTMETSSIEDIQALDRAVRFHFINDPDLVALAEHILEQVKLKEETK